MGSKRVGTIFMLVAILMISGFSAVHQVSAQALWTTGEQSYQTGNGTRITIVTTLDESGENRIYQGINYVKYMVGNTVTFSILVKVEEFGTRIDRLHECRVSVSILYSLGFEVQQQTIAELNAYKTADTARFSYYLSPEFFYAWEDGHSMITGIQHLFHFKEGVQLGTDETYDLGWDDSVNFLVQKPEPKTAELVAYCEIGYPVILGERVDVHIEIQNYGNANAEGVSLQFIEYYTDVGRTVENDPWYIGMIAAQDGEIIDSGWLPEELGSVEIKVIVTATNADTVSETWWGYVEDVRTTPTYTTTKTEMGDPSYYRPEVKDTSADVLADLFPFLIVFGIILAAVLIALGIRKKEAPPPEVKEQEPVSPPETQPPTTPPIKFCPNCGIEIPLPGKFCPKCGAAL